VDFQCFTDSLDEKTKRRIVFYKVINGLVQSGLTLGYSVAKLLKKISLLFH